MPPVRKNKSSTASSTDASASVSASSDPSAASAASTVAAAGGRAPARRRVKADPESVPDTTATAADTTAAASSVDDASGSDPTSSSGVESDVILAEFNRIDKLIEEFSKRVPILRNKMRTARKLYTQERKAARTRPSRAAARAARAAAAASGGADVPRKASSFTKEVAISDIMANFMGLPVGSRPRRNDAVNHVTKYIKDNKLNQSRTILPDDRLKALLGPLQEGHTEYHYFTLQKYLARHFGQKAIDSGLVSNANPSVSVSAPAS